jgi:hypothetical protein
MLPQLVAAANIAGRLARMAAGSGDIPRLGKAVDQRPRRPSCCQPVTTSLVQPNASHMQAMKSGSGLIKR